MAGGNLELARQGGRVNSDTGMLFTSTDFDRIGGMGIQNMMHQMMLYFRDEPNAVPMSGFPRDEFDSDYCKVTATGNLTYSVSTGWGLGYNSANLAASEFEATAYLPIVVDAAITGSLAAHDATNPRIDKICLAPAFAADQTVSRNVKNPTTGAVSSSSISQRQRYSYAVQVVTGTPAATPVAPATPTGYICIGTALVPASSGAAVWSDDRPMIELGSLFHNRRYWTADFVPDGDPDELLVAATSPTSMTVSVAAGRAVINGVMRAYAKTYNLTIAAAHATLERYDLIVANEDRTITRVAGANGAVGAAAPPAVPANATPLAQIYVGPAVGSISSGAITDLRLRQPFTGDLIQDNSVPGGKLSLVPMMVVQNGVTVFSGDTATISFDLLHPDFTTPITSKDTRLSETNGDGFVPQFLVTVIEAVADSIAGSVYDETAPDVQRLIRHHGDTIGEDDVALAVEAPLVTLEPQTGTALVFFEQMQFAISGTDLDAGGPWSITVRRKTVLVTGDYIVEIRPINHPGAGLRRIVTFS